MLQFESYYNRRQSKSDQRSNWMKAFNDAVVQGNPSLAGKINWDTATFMFNRGDDPKMAAELYLKSPE